MKLFLKGRLFLCSASLLSITSASFVCNAQNYSYLPESFEGNEWTAKAAEVKSPTGVWATNKNAATTSSARSGASSLEFLQKAGITSPELAEGAGTLIYWAKDINRQVNVEVSSDKSEWRTVESYKETSDWTKHSVPINDPSVRFVRISITSNSQFHLDDILITKPDGTDGNGETIVTDLELPYFTNDFEHSGYPSSKEEAASEKQFTIDGQGEWSYLNAYKSTNPQYIPDGSSRALRMLKNGSHVTTPVLHQGVVRISFNSGRPGKKLNIYTSTDEGKTWNLAKEVVTDIENELRIDEKSVNRVRIANESSSDNDIDNISVSAFPIGTPASVETGDVSEITSSSATVALRLTDNGTGRLIEKGICWSVDGNPEFRGNRTMCADNESHVVLSGLPAASEIKCRGYVLSLAGISYGETRTFSTSQASVPSVRTGDISVNDELSTETTISVTITGTVTDNGGAQVEEAGICYSSSGSLPDADGEKALAKSIKDLPADFSVNISLKPETTYRLRAFARNSSGVSYGDEITYTTGTIEIPDYPHNVYYCDPEGDDTTADGSKEHPFRSLQLAVDKVAAGDRIVMRAGTYRYFERINIPTVGAKGSGMIKLESEGGRAILDFSEMSVLSNNQGIRLTGSYWHFYGIDICNAGDNGLLIERNKKTGETYTDIQNRSDEAHDNIIENCNFYRNADTGLQMKNLASFNMVINCDSYFNADPSHGDADGFAVKISHGDGNYFFGCRAWNNSDDGWDQFIKKEGGFPDDITTTLEECWAFRNGYLENDTKGNGNGNGFKMGSNQGRNNVVMNSCLAFENLNKGFDQNHNTGNMILNNCTGFSSKDTSGKSRYSYRLDEAVAKDHEIRLTNCVAISDGISDRNKSAYAPHSVKGTLVTSDLNTLPEDYTSIEWKLALAERNEDGSLPRHDFMAIREGNTKLIDSGSIVEPYDGESLHSNGILYNGEAPDLGCFETGENSSGILVDDKN